MSVDPERVKQVAARVARGLSPVPDDDELVCRRPGCGRPLGEGSMDGCCYLCAQELRRNGRWSTRKLFDPESVEQVGGPQFDPSAPIHDAREDEDEG